MQYVKSHMVRFASWSESLSNVTDFFKVTNYKFSKLLKKLKWQTNLLCLNITCNEIFQGCHWLYFSWLKYFKSSNCCAGARSRQARSQFKSRWFRHVSTQAHYTVQQTSGLPCVFLICILFFLLPLTRKNTSNIFFNFCFLIS